MTNLVFPTGGQTVACLLSWPACPTCKSWTCSHSVFWLLQNGQRPIRHGHILHKAFQSCPPWSWPCLSTSKPICWLLYQVCASYIWGASAVKTLSMCLFNSFQVFNELSLAASTCNSFFQAFGILVGRFSPPLKAAILSSNLIWHGQRQDAVHILGSTRSIGVAEVCWPWICHIQRRPFTFYRGHKWHQAVAYWLQ